MKMRFQFSSDFRGSMDTRLEDNICGKEYFENEMDSFEKFININTEDGSFEEEQGKLLNDSTFKIFEKKETCCLKEFLDKLSELSADYEEALPYCEDIMEYYKYLTENNYIDENDDEISSIYKQAFYYAKEIADERENSIHTINTVQDKAEAKRLRFSMYKVLWVYLDLCGKFENIIDAEYKKMLNKKLPRFKTYATKIQKSTEKNFKFTQLSWTKNAGNYLENHTEDFTRYGCIKFYGEAGAGKTTELEELYYNELELVKNGECEVYPIWIELKNLRDVEFENEESILEKTIEKILNITELDSELFEFLLENNMLSLYLDGYNEFLANNDEHLEKKTKLGIEINKIHNEYHQLRIYMTDRNKVSTPNCLNDNGIVFFEAVGMNNSEMNAYAEKYLTEIEKEKFTEFLDSADSEWMKNEKMVPFKMNMLFDLLRTGASLPNDKNEFYRAYIVKILNREIKKKAEKECDTFRDLLAYLAIELGNANETMNMTKICALWRTKVEIDEVKLQRLFKLAVQLPILVPENEETEVDDFTQYKFKNSEYFNYYITLLD